MKWHKLQRIVFIAFVGSVLTALLLYYFLAEDFSLTVVRAWLRHFGIWAPLAFIMLYVLGTIFIPSTPFMALAGVLFGFKYGLAYTIIGGLISSSLVFLLSRKLGKEAVDDILKNKHLKILAKYDKRLQSRGIVDLIVLRMLPIMPFNILNLLMGISQIKTRDYVIGTVLGLIPSIIITVYFGSFILKIF